MWLGNCLYQLHIYDSLVYLHNIHVHNCINSFSLLLYDSQWIYVAWMISIACNNYLFLNVSVANLVFADMAKAVSTGNILVRFCFVPKLLMPSLFESLIFFFFFKFSISLVYSVLILIVYVLLLFYNKLFILRRLKY